MVLYKPKYNYIFFFYYLIFNSLILFSNKNLSTHFRQYPTIIYRYKLVFLVDLKLFYKVVIISKIICSVVIPTTIIENN